MGCVSGVNIWGVGFDHSTKEIVVKLRRWFSHIFFSRIFVTLLDSGNSNEFGGVTDFLLGRPVVGILRIEQLRTRGCAFMRFWSFQRMKHSKYAPLQTPCSLQPCDSWYRKPSFLPSHHAVLALRGRTNLMFSSLVAFGGCPRWCLILDPKVPSWGPGQDGQTVNFGG